MRCTERLIVLLAMFLMILCPFGSTVMAAGEVPAYADYLAQWQDAPQPETSIQIAAGKYSDLHDSGAYVEAEETQGIENALIWSSAFDKVSYAFTVEEAGLYELQLTYLPLASRQMDLEFSFMIDGAFPFDKLQNVTLYRMYQPDGEITRDNRDNDVRPKLQEVSAWQTVSLQDVDSYYVSPYLVYLSQGEHTLTLSMLAEAMAISQIEFINPSQPLSYEEYIAEHQHAAAKATSSITIQAENSASCSSQVIYPISERANVATQPSDPVKTRMNTIGGDNWKQQGQWVEWDFEVEEEGFYNLTIRGLQEFSRGMPSMRQLTLDGQVPFTQAQQIDIPFKVDWQMFTLGGEETPMAMYLTPGEHTLRMTVSGSRFSESLRRLTGVISDMSTLYRQIIIITGDNADAERITIDLNRDFQLEKKIPNFNQTLESMAQILREEEARIASYAGSGSEAALLIEIAVQLESFIKKPETMPERLEAFKSNLSSLSEWALQISSQPLQIDYLTFTPVGSPLPDGGVGFFDQMAFRWDAFIGSFTENYNAVGQIYDDGQEEEITLTVWVCANDLGATGIGSGRDQTQLIKELIDQTFVPETGIRVNLSLIDGSTTLMQATLGGKGPDVALTVYKELPVNLAMRGALADLSQFEGFDEIKERFYESALIPYKYQDGIFALPETQNFYVIFYREDMFDELGLTIPNTWQEMKDLIPVLSKMGMRAAIPEPTVTNNNTLGFQIHLFQRGLNYYTDDLQKTKFDETLALDAFKEWTDLYTKYSCPVKYDFFSRFRTGEIPIALDSYVMANTLAAAAPELDGLWNIAPIPGVLQEDGTIDRSEGAMGTGAVVMSTSKHQEAGFQFISWWTSDETQTTFGNSLENLMGAAARWPTANKNAFLNMHWPKDQQQAILEQWQYVDDIPQLPGNYIINRNLSFAFRAVVYDDAPPRDVLATYNKEINKEIQRKWAEFQGMQEVEQ